MVIVSRLLSAIGARFGWTARDWLVAGLVVAIAVASTGAQVVVHRHADRAAEVNQAISGVRLAVLTAHGAATRLAPGPAAVPLQGGGAEVLSEAEERRSATADLATARETLRDELAAVLSPAELARTERLLDGFALTLAKAEAVAAEGTGGVGALIDQLGASQLLVFRELEEIEVAYLAAMSQERTRLLVTRIGLTVAVAVAVLALASAFSRARSRSAYLASSRAALAWSEERFRSLVQHSSDIIAIYDRDGVIRYLGGSFERVLGRDVEAWVGRGSRELCHPADQMAVAVAFARALAEPGTPQQVEVRLQHADGSWRWFDVVGQAGTDPAVVDGVVVNARDVTERKALEEERRDSERRYRSLVERTPAITYVTEDNAVGPDDYRFAFVSPQMTTITGWTVEEVLATTRFLDLVHPDDRGRLTAENEAASGTGAFEGEYRLLTRTGESVWVHDSSSLLDVDEEGRERWQGVLIDISEEKRARFELEAATERFRALVEQTPAVTYVVGDVPDAPAGTPRWRYVFVSPQIEAMTGYTAECWLAVDPIAVVHPEDRERFAEANTAAERTDVFECEYRVLRADGGEVWVHDLGRRLRVDGRELGQWQGVILDISEEKRARLELEAATGRFRTLVEQIPAVVYELAVDPHDPNGRRFTYVSPAFERIYEVSPERLMTEPELRAGLVHPEDRAMVNAVMAGALADHGPVSLDFRAVTASGRVRWVNDQRRFLSREADGTEIWQGLITDVTAAREANESLREAERRYRTLVEEVPVVTYRLAIHTVHREDRHYKYLSPQFEHMTGFGVQAWMDDKTLWDQAVHPEDYDRIIQGHVEHSNVRGWFDISYRMRRADGSEFWCREVARRVAVDAEGYALWQGVWLDVTAQKEAELASRDREEEFRLLFSSNPQPTWVYDRETHEFLEVNTAASMLYGYDRDTFLTMRVEQLFAAAPSEPGPGSITDQLRESIGRNVQHVTSEGRPIEVEMTSHALRFRGRSARLVIAQDVTARHALEARLVHQAYHDTLTGLPNRALFSDRLQVALTKERPVAVLFVDLDDFKVINDTLGHEVGDALLLAVGERLLGTLRPQDTIARLGGDEFTVLLENADLEAAVRVADRLIAELSVPFRLEGHDVVVSPSIGIAQNVGGDEQPEELLRRADVAMYEAKTTGKRRHATFEARMDVLAWQRLELESELRRAIAEDELTLAYQPIVDLATGAVTEVEALVRWLHPERGLLPPGEFIGIAEQSGLILELDTWVLNAAARQMAGWVADGAMPKAVSVAVNLSARQFQGQTLVHEVEEALRRTGLPTGRLKLEITETVALSDIPSTLVMLRELKSLGVSLAIDDFGSGYSGLSYLQRCPIDTVKIDRSYVDGIGVHPGDTAMIRAVMAFARTLGLKVTAEGVETEVQLRELKALAVDSAQGFLFARPLPPEEVVALVRERELVASF